MKKRNLSLLAVLVILCLVFGSVVCLASCGDITETPANPENGENESKNDPDPSEGNDPSAGGQEEDPEGEELPPVELEQGTPQSWIDLFTFDNVTVLFKNTLTVKRGDEYKCVDGKWYCKYQSTDTFEPHSGRYIFDLYLGHYSVFTYDEDSSCYRATGVDMDGTGYLHEITISLFEGKIKNITDSAVGDALTIVTTIDFSAYGETAIG